MPGVVILIPLVGLVLNHLAAWLPPFACPLFVPRLPASWPATARRRTAATHAAAPCSPQIVGEDQRSVKAVMDEFGVALRPDSYGKDVKPLLKEALRWGRVPLERLRDVFLRGCSCQAALREALRAWSA